MTPFPPMLSSIELRRFRPLIIARLVLYVVLAIIIVILAIRLELPILVLFIAAFATAALLEIWRYNHTKIRLHSGMLIASQGWLSINEMAYRRMRVDVVIHRSFLGSLCDFGDVTIISETTRTTIRSIAELRLLEAWLEQY